VMSRIATRTWSCRVYTLMCTVPHQQHGRTGSTIDSAAQQQHTHTHPEFYDTHTKSITGNNKAHSSSTHRGLWPFFSLAITSTRGAFDGLAWREMKSDIRFT
jgi:hypothetical protein